MRMCLQWMKIRSVNKQASKGLFVPCGKCYECQQMIRSSWEFRFRAEVEEYCIRQNWQMCFFTLTYNEQNLPYLPPHCFKDYDEELNSSASYIPVPCFNKDDVRNLVHGLRKYLNRQYGVTRLIYLVCAEYGEHTKRPHYHGSICFPPEVPAKEMYQCIRDLWCAEEGYIKQPRKLCGKESVIDVSKARRNKGFICPRVFEGYMNEKPFMVETQQAVNAAKYTAKYVSKDIAFMRDLPYGLLKMKRNEKSKIPTNEDEYENLVFEQLPHIRNYLPFHFQTRDLGFGLLENKTNEQLLDLFKNGYNFIGKDKADALPVYLKNKILFTPLYVVDESGRRLVRRETTEFFNQNYKEIFEKKVGFYEELFNQMCDRNYYKSRSMDDKQSDKWSKEVAAIVNWYGTSKQLAEDYLNYFGKNCGHCYCYPDKAFIYYNSFQVEDVLNEGSIPCISYDDDWTIVQDVLGLLLGIQKFVVKYNQSEEERLINKIADFWKSLPSDRIKQELSYGFSPS